MDPTEALDAVLAGRAEVIDDVEQVPHASLTAAAHGKKLSVTAPAVVLVLERFRVGAISADQAQRWASMIFWGHHGSAVLPLRALDFDYDELDHQDAIADAVLHLEQLGDLIDGEIDATTNAGLQDALRAQDRSSHPT